MKWGMHVPKPGLFKPPRFRSGQDTETERHATWLELFYDLVFVAAVSQLSKGLGEDYSWEGVFRFSVLVRDAIAVENLEQCLLRRISQHGKGRCADQPDSQDHVQSTTTSGCLAR